MSNKLQFKFKSIVHRRRAGERLESDGKSVLPFLFTSVGRWVARSPRWHLRLVDPERAERNGFSLPSRILEINPDLPADSLLDYNINKNNSAEKILSKKV